MGKVLRVRIKDYQVLKDISFELQKGTITSIVGQSNNGKSSIVRAIESAIFNKGGSSFINYDADYCEVEIDDITWNKNRDSSKSFYKIGDTVLNKIGQQQIEEVADSLGIKELLIADEKVRLNFSKQLEFPFLVGKTSFQLFNFISNSKEQEIIGNLKEQEDINAKAYKKEIDKKTIENDLNKKRLAEVNFNLIDLEKYKEIDVRKIETAIDIKESIDDFLILKEEKELELERLSKIAKRNRETLKEITDLEDEIKDKIKVYSKLDLDLESIESNSKELELLKIKQEEDKKVYQVLESRVKELRELRDLYNKTKEQYNNLDTELSLIEKLKVEKEEIKGLTKTIESAMIETKERLKEFKVCPLCKKPLGESDIC